MRLGIVSDVHCNILGLNAALEIMGEIDRLICLGDCIDEYRFSNEVVQTLIDTDAWVIKGNHEEVFFGPLGGRARARPGNDPSLMRWLEEQPYRRELILEGQEILLVHSTAWEPRGAYIHPDSPELTRFAQAGANIVMYGHTHQQVNRRIDGTLIINPGSCGDGRDHRNQRQLSCAVLELPGLHAEIMNFPDPARARS